ncbi:uncharacterized protein M421DRAFT_3925 [Didymella exigua CBS 183.55]|uniref:Uncharacterized protein n=1 Tax=Didymella exigua CBS 183.55 TaxID=1150837 RepID=A0A6A5RRD0_9PLEO|nr:uncharacterized protein M421DRAFT_3925 [Didymella exigua CBS 183.55]KAF1930179.1 hypothetical protein M421DRAFT_3925 [Didymella exigua CBS 183.55]
MQSLCRRGECLGKQLLPLALSTLFYIAAAVAYAVTLILFPHAEVGLSEQITWIVIAIVEGLAVLIINMTWRIVSFNSSAYVAYLHNSMSMINNRFRSKKWEVYDSNVNLTATNNQVEIYSFKTPMWTKNTGESIRKLVTKAQVFVFKAHADTIAKLNAVTPVNQAVVRDTRKGLRLP